MSCGQIALVEEGFTINEYYASEIEKNAIKVTQENFPNTKQLGDIRNISEERLKKLPKIDLILCGFPCRDLSICTRNGGSKNWENMHSKGEGLNGEHSGLYHNFLYIFSWLLKHNNSNVKFLVENVASMKYDEKATIDNDLGVVGVEIDSALFSAQERKRLYWTNIPIRNADIGYCTYVLKDILDDNVPDKFYENREIEFNNESDRLVGRLIFDFKAHDIAKRIYNIKFKSPTLTSCRGGNLQKKVYVDGRCRKLTPNEYRKLQTIPDWYKMNVSNSQIYNMCGDGWTVDVIRHIFRGLKDL